MRNFSRSSSSIAVGAALLLALSSCTGFSASDYAPATNIGPSDDVPREHNIHGIDISKYQGTIDWHEVKRSGVSFAFIKATEGGDFHDQTFMINWLAARDAGVPRGAYHFYYWCRPARDQIAWFKKHVPVDPNALPPVLDVEWTPYSPTCPKRPPTSEIHREMAIFLKEMERHYGKKPIIYTSVDLHQAVLEGKFLEYPMWLRSVAGHPSTKYERRHWTFWQFTGTGRVPGVKGKVDRNVFAGTKKDLERWIAGEISHRDFHRI